MKTWADFFDYYLTDLTGCTTFAAQNELRRAAQQFCEESGAWRVTMDPATLVADVSVYDFDLTKQMELVKFLSATLDEDDMLVLNAGQSAGGAIAIKALNSRTFEVYPDPAGGEILTMKAIVKPSEASTGIDDDLFAQYAESIAYGARARLMMKKDKPYTDHALAAVNHDLFKSAIGAAKIKTAKAYSSAPRRVKSIF